MPWFRRRERPAVSIVVATHNRASMLPGALNSVLEQDYPNLEVVVVDDGSTDGTPALLDDYARQVAEGAIPHHAPRQYRSGDDVEPRL